MIRSIRRLAFLSFAALTTLVSLDASAQMCARAEGDTRVVPSAGASWVTPTLFFEISGDCFDACGHITMPFLDSATATGTPMQRYNMVYVNACPPKMLSKNDYNPARREFSSEAANYEYVGFGCEVTGRELASAICPCRVCFFPTPGEDPLVISVADAQFRFTHFEAGVKFDLNADGELEPTAWTLGSSDDAFLVLDRNFNGQIDDGHEIFGDETPQLPSETPNGFRALAVFDDPQSGGNYDGKIDSQDRIYRDLMLWTDTNHDGRSSSSELRPLSDEVGSIQLAYQQDSTFDEHGNELRYRAAITRRTGSEGSTTAWNVFFANQKTTEEKQDAAREQKTRRP